MLPKIVSAQTWQSEINKLRTKEKQLTRQTDAVSALRRQLPMVKITKDYLFQSDQGDVCLLDLFAKHKQLIVYHFMFDPDWEAGCDGCSWVADAMPHLAHLHARDTSLVMISRAPLKKLQAYKKRMGWDLPWVSSTNTDFNQDFGATVDGEDHHGVSVFLRDNDVIYRTYYTGARGVEHLGSHWTYLDITPYGRQETWEDSPDGWPKTEPYKWIRRHDEYSD